MRMVAHQASLGRLRQEHLAQAIATWAPRATSLNIDQAQYLQGHLAPREAHLEHVRLERDTHFAQEEELLAHMRLLSSEAKDWKPRVVSEAEQVLVREPAGAAQRTTEVQEAMDKQFQVRWREAETQLMDVRESNSSQVQQLAASLQRSHK